MALVTSMQNTYARSPRFSSPVGRDAADVAITHSFWPNVLAGFQGRTAMGMIVHCLRSDLTAQGRCRFLYDGNGGSDKNGERCVGDKTRELSHH